MKTPLNTNTQLGEKLYPDRETLGDLTQKDQGEAVPASNESNVQVADSERVQLVEHRAELRSIIDREQDISGLNNEPSLSPSLELPKYSGINPVSRLYSTLSELQTGMEGMLADEKNPLIRFGIKISLKLNQVSLFFLADMLGLRDKRGEDIEEEKDEKRNKLALLKAEQNKLNALKHLNKFSFLSFLNIFKNSPEYQGINQQELATQI